MRENSCLSLFFNNSTTYAHPRHHINEMFDKIDGIHYEDEQAIAYLPVPRAPWRHFVRQRPKLKIAIVLGHHVKVPYQYCDY